MPKVINLHRPLGGVSYTRVDRGSEWGNPFIMARMTEQERACVCDLFEVYALWRLTVEPEWLAPLRGKHLACWCTPKRCHAETLLRLANESERTNYKEYDMGESHFSWALIQLKAGKKVARHGWNGEGTFVFLVPGSSFLVNRPPLLGIYPEGTEIQYHAHVDMKTADGQIVPWLCSQTDLLAEDWEIVL